MPFPKNCPQLQDLPGLPPQEIAALPADVAPAPFALAVRQALAKTPGERPRDAAAFASALQVSEQDGVGRLRAVKRPAQLAHR